MDNTIAAIATPVGEGGIGIVRISGDESLNILKKIFKPFTNSDIESRKLTYGHIINPGDGTIVDEVLAVYMKGPKTYTAEDVVEINCHGGLVPLKRVLELVLTYGAQIAEPGEFTKRAFLNGRLDLSQAEAVIDVIRAKTDKSFDVAMNQLQGGFSKVIEDIRHKLVDVLVNLTVNIDYPDEDIEEINNQQLISDLTVIRSDIQKLLDGSKSGKILRDGVNVAIIGKPNVGKSSLMNNLLRESRAIVTEIPGTTRDTIEEFININGIPVKITDTAGIRNSDDIIEQIGIEKSKQSFNDADFVIFILDISRPLDDEDKVIIEKINHDKTLFVYNKIDKPAVISDEVLAEITKDAPFVKTTMNDIEGTMVIEKELYNLISSKNENLNDTNLISNARHIDSLKKAISSIDDALNSAMHGQAFEFVEIDVSAAYENLGFITGDSVREDIIDEVFSRFCLGK